MAPSEGRWRAGAVVLAAGEAQRFGAPKLLMRFGESTVVGCVVAALQKAELSPIVVVAGSHHPRIAEALRDTAARVLRNPAPGRGMISSVRVGAEALPADLDGLVIALGDQPRVNADVILRILRVLRTSGKGIAIPVCRGKRGHPVALAARYRLDIIALGDHETLRDLIHAHRDDLVEVACTSDAVVQDIDTRDEYEEQLRRQRDDG